MQQGTSSPRAGRSVQAIAVFAGVAAGVLGADLWLKHWGFTHLLGVPVGPGASPPAPIPPHAARPLVPGLLSLQLTLNRGMVFGMGEGGRWLFVGVSVAAAGVLLRLFWVGPPRAFVQHAALGLILAGAMGNLYDRVRFGAVRDMLLMLPGWQLPLGWRWPGEAGAAGPRLVYPWIFNIADAALVIGVLVMLGVSWWRQRQRQRQTAGSDPR